MSVVLACAVFVAADFALRFVLHFLAERAAERRHERLLGAIGDPGDVRIEQVPPEDDRPERVAESIEESVREAAKRYDVPIETVGEREPSPRSVPRADVPKGSAAERISRRD